MTKTFRGMVLICGIVVFALANAAYGLLHVHFPEKLANIPFAAVAVIDGLALAGLLYVYFRGFAKLGHWRLWTGAREAERPKDAVAMEVNYTDAFLVKTIPDVLCVKDGSGRWLQARKEYLKFFNLGGIEYRGKTNAELGLNADAGLDALEFDEQQDGAAWSLGKARKDTSTSKLVVDKKRYDITRIPIYAEDGQALRLLITGSLRHKDTSVKSRIFPALFYSSHICFILLDADFKIILVNKAFMSLTGFSESDCMHKDLFFLEHEKRIKFNASFFFTGHPERLWSGELNCCRKEGEAIPVKMMMSLLDVPGTSKASPHYIVNMYDITEQRLHENRILRLAHYDDITGLPNRIMFCDHLTKMLETARSHDSCLVVFFLDLDRFKSVNDSLGHQAGDELLKEVGERLKRHIKPEDIVARLSGDEFGILITDEKSYETAIFSSTIIAQKIINDISRNFHIQRQQVFIGVSIGISIFPEDAATVDDLLRNADMAMYEAKRQGRNGYEFFNIEHIRQTKERSQIETGLRSALNKHELQLYYQPQCIAQSRELCGAEVLLRWIPGDSKAIPPTLFIPIAEEIGLITSIGKWILESACQQQSRWLHDGHKIQQVSVNVSARQFLDPNFIDIVEEALAKAELDAKHLELEITESMLIGDTKKIEMQLSRLKRIGVTLALDDFGTGYSSLSYLKDFPIDVLKIDRSFIMNMKEGSKESRITCAIIDIGHSLGQKVVAEGVETEAQYDYLLKHGCDIIQGYYFSCPLSTLEMTKFLADPHPIKAPPLFPVH